MWVQIYNVFVENSVEQSIFFFINLIFMFFEVLYVIQKEDVIIICNEEIVFFLELENKCSNNYKEKWNDVVILQLVFVALDF